MNIGSGLKSDSGNTAVAASHFLKLKSKIIKIVQSRNGC
jgi:hypothetical protein